MNTIPAGAPARPLRLWPGVALAVLLLVVKLIAPMVTPQATPIGVLAGPLLGLAIGIWWAFFSRVPHAERWGALLLIALAMVATSRPPHVSSAPVMLGYIFGHAIPSLR